MESIQDRLEEQYLAALVPFNPAGLKAFANKVRSNARNPRRLFDLIAEARVALMFLRNGWNIVLRDSPDLRLEHNGDVVFAEVKHFHRKLQDQIDENTMRVATDDDFLVPVGNILRLEGVEAWRQIANVAAKKVEQYVESACNILVIVSSSESLELMAASAAHEYDDHCRSTSDAAYRRLSGIMLINTRSLSFVPGYSNVEFEPTACAACPLIPETCEALREIRMG